MSEPWYKNGLRFQCTRSGRCCVGEPGFVWVNAQEVEAIASWLGEKREEVEAIYTRRVAERRSLREKSGGACIFFDVNQGCKIYPVRPRQCRTWPFWDSNLASPADWERTCRHCPGAGQGELISAQEITRRRQIMSL